MGALDPVIARLKQQLLHADESGADGIMVQKEDLRRIVTSHIDMEYVLDGMIEDQRGAAERGLE